MNARLNAVSQIAEVALEGDERWHVVQRVLASPAFAKAPRMCALLSFLMVKKLSGMEAGISEYAIGIEVFRRDARDYDTTIDPVVRVQMGRLRQRLAQYYAIPGMDAGLRIVIPAGTYVPILAEGASPQRAPVRRVRLAPLRMLSPQGGGDAFASGLEEELALQVFQRFGGGHANSAPQDYCIDVSVRVEPDHARAMVRLVDAVTGQIVWLRQCDRHGDLGIGLQEELALAICDDLQVFMGSSMRHGPRHAAYKG